MKKISLFRLPIVWLFLGPPIFRAGERSSLASVSGDHDIWNLVRGAWWLFWGIVAIVELFRERERIGDHLHRLGVLPYFVACWLFALFISILISPAPFFSLTYVGMQAILVLAAMDLSVKVGEGVISLRRLLGILLIFSTGLILLVSIAYLAGFDSLKVNEQSAMGVRIRGAPIAYTPILSIVVILVSLYYLLRRETPWRWPLLGLMALGFYWLYLGQTRSAYGGFIVAAAVFTWHWARLRFDVVRLMSAVAAVLSGIALIGVLYGSSTRTTEYVDYVYQRFVLRDGYAIQNREHAWKSLSSLNGRTAAVSILLEGVSSHPLGFGYIAGSRSYMSSPGVVERLPSTSFMGAHNSHVEMLAGAGFPGFFGWVMTLLWLLWHGRRARVREATLLRILMFVVVFEAFFENSLAFPFTQSAVLFWMAAASIAAVLANQPSRILAMKPVEGLRRRPVRPVAALSRPGPRMRPHPYST